jgi:hypothetical protein
MLTRGLLSEKLALLADGRGPSTGAGQSEHHRVENRSFDR